MPATVFQHEDGLRDPDDLKMPESPDHRRAIDAIGLAATGLLGPDHLVFRDMNWYPTDSGNAIAPDVMVLPAGAFVHPPDADPATRLKSYQQVKSGGPLPTVVVEVPSKTDSYTSLRGKAERCRALGVTVYVVAIDPPLAVDRYAVGETGTDDWVGQPIPELGGLRLTFNNGELTIMTPDGLTAISDHDLLTQLGDRAIRAEQRAEGAEHRAVLAEQRAFELERRLREAGLDPDD